MGNVVDETPWANKWAEQREDARGTHYRKVLRENSADGELYFAWYKDSDGVERIQVDNASGHSAVHRGAHRFINNLEIQLPPDRAMYVYSGDSDLDHATGPASGHYYVLQMEPADPNYPAAPGLLNSEVGVKYSEDNMRFKSIDPRQNAIGVCTQLKAVLDRHEEVRAQLVRSGFSLPSQLTQYLPADMNLCGLREAPPPSPKHPTRQSKLSPR